MDVTKAQQLIGYVRVSTSEQAGSGLGLAAQEAKVRDAAERDGHQLVEVIADAGEHGTTLEGPGLRRALAMIAAGEADGLIAAKLDRVSRSVIDFATLLEWFNTARAALVILDPQIDTTTPSGRLVANVFAAVAEWEADTIAQRTRDALGARKASGAPGGRPAVAQDPVLAERIGAMRAEGLTLRAIAEALNAAGTPTVRGGRMWQVSAVHSVLGYKRPPASRRPTDLPDPRPRRRARRTV